jgi:V-type H+-transporting ATPase subunit a
MTFALCLQLPNHIRFKRAIDVWANFIPQIIFLESIFGYLVITILYKWSIDWSQRDQQPPQLLNMLINMFLSPGTVDKEEQLYPGQGIVQAVLLLMAVICIPWLLIMKPYHEWKQMKKIQGEGYIGLPHADGDDLAPRDSSDGDLEGEEEGNGRAIAEDASEEEHVSGCVI